jgi:hypothetical protein
MVIVIGIIGFVSLQFAFAHRTIGIGALINGLNAFIGVVHDAVFGRTMRKTLVVAQFMNNLT